MGSQVNIISSSRKPKNLLYNSSFARFERFGTTTGGTVAAYFLAADRWGFFSGAVSSYAINRVAHSNPIFTLGQGRHGIKIQRNAGNSSTGTYQFNQTLERRDSEPIAGKTITLSFSAKKGANYSALNSILQAYIVYTLGNPDTNIINGWVSPVAAGLANVTLTNTMTRFKVTGTIPAGAVGVAVNFHFTPTGTAGADDSYTLEDVMLELGNEATPFETMGANFTEEITLCKRFFQRGIYAGVTGLTIGATTGYLMMVLPVEMRVPPVPGINVDVGGVNAIDEVLISPRSVSAVGTLIPGTKAMAITFTSSGMTSNRFVRPNTDFFYLDAEL